MTNPSPIQISSTEILPQGEMREVIERVEPNYYRHFNFNETDCMLMAQEAWRIHADGYLAMKFVNEGAITPEGFLTTDIDKARGDNVEYILALNSDEEQDCASMRKIHLPESGSFVDLPAYTACGPNLSEEGIERLTDLESNGFTVKEISALAKTKDANPRAVFELFRNAIHGGMGKKEAFFFSMVSITHEVLTPRLSRANFLILGDDTDINDPRVEPGVRLRPLLTMPDEFNENIYQAFLNADSNVAKRKLAQSLVFYTDGLPRHQMSKDVFTARQQIVESFKREGNGS